MSTNPRPVLSPGECHLLRMAGAGVAGVELAEELGEPLTATAARFHRIRERLQVGSTAQAVFTARTLGLLEDN